jgi:hypothetical protein
VAGQHQLQGQQDLKDEMKQGCFIGRSKKEQKEGGRLGKMQQTTSAWAQRFFP